MKLGIIGLGNVGSSFAYRCVISGIAQEIMLVDIDHQKAVAEAHDLQHVISYERQTVIEASDYAGLIGSDYVVVAAGAAQKSGQTRLELLESNSMIISEIAENVAQFVPNAVLIVATNPVDVMTYIMWNRSRFDRKRVLGSGTLLDTARFHYNLAIELGEPVHSIQGYVVGDHGDNQVPLYSSVTVGGEPFDSYCKNMNIQDVEQVKQIVAEKTRKNAYSIIDGKGYTNYGIASTLYFLLQSLVRDSQSKIPISMVHEELFGMSDIPLSLPTRVNGDGVLATGLPNLTEPEKILLELSAKSIFDVLPKY